MLVASGSAVNILMEVSSVADRVREALAEPEVSVRACEITDHWFLEYRRAGRPGLRPDSPRPVTAED